jgi:O-antigen ligase
LGAESSFLSLYHPNSLALYLVLSLAFIPGIVSEVVQNYRRRTVKTLGTLAVLELTLLTAAEVMVLAVWLTYSRGALSALIFGALVGLIALAILRVVHLSRRATVALGVVVVAVLGTLLVTDPAFLGRYASLLNPVGLTSDPDVTFRVDVYSRALKIITAHPLTGIGLQQFATTGQVPFSPHNTYLDLWVGAGVFAMLAFVAVLLLGLFGALAKARDFSKSGDWVAMFYSIGFAIALATFIVQGLVEAYDTNLRIALIVWMLALCANGSLASLRSPRLRPHEPTMIAPAAIAPAAIAPAAIAPVASDVPTAPPAPMRSVAESVEPAESA